MINLTDNTFYKENEIMYEVLSDYIIEKLREVPINGTSPLAKVDIELSDCFLDSFGNLFTPNSYYWTKDGDEDKYIATYDSEPTLTKHEIAEMVASVDSPEINDKSRNI